MNRENEKLDIKRQVKLSFIILFPQKISYLPLKIIYFPISAKKSLTSGVGEMIFKERGPTRGRVNHVENINPCVV